MTSLGCRGLLFPNPLYCDFFLRINSNQDQDHVHAILTSVNDCIIVTNTTGVSRCPVSRSCDDIVVIIKQALPLVRD